MGLFKKKADPISDRSKALSDEIAALEAKIKRLDTQLQQNPARRQANLRTTALPDGRTISHSETAPAAPLSPTPAEPIFEEVDQNRLKGRGEAASTPEHYNELGVRKYDLPALLRRLRNQFSGPSASNPKLVNYLAAGGIQGLRPLRYEKRVARNRFIFFVAILFLILLGIFIVFHP
ncbi:MAG TPA: hypothetical protein VK327_04390 [Candidatus Paceibacterota bacterium]|nr:hypothetical protein [Candidatus Paceibacterota bacterium]